MVKEDVVISGFSGRFPESANMEEFKENLLSGMDMVTADNRRWPLGISFNFSLEYSISCTSWFFVSMPKKSTCFIHDIRVSMQKVVHNICIYLLHY